MPVGILPSDIRYALQWKEAQFGKEEILCLLRNGFENEALYFFLKSASPSPERQRALLQECARSLGSIDDGGYGEKTAHAVREFVEDFASWIPRNATVAGAKVAQLSRQGFAYWHSILAQMAERCARDPRRTYIIGHAMFVGLPAFLQTHRRCGKQLRIIIPDLALNRETEVCGYVVDTSSVTLLRKDFARDHEALVVDDTCHTGACKAVVARFWKHGYPDAPPHEFIVMDQAA